MRWRCIFKLAEIAHYGNEAAAEWRSDVEAAHFLHVDAVTGVQACQGGRRLAGAGKRGGDIDDDAATVDGHAKGGEVVGNAIEFRQDQQANPSNQQNGQRTGEKLAMKKRQGRIAGTDGWSWVVWGPSSSTNGRFGAGPERLGTASMRRVAVGTE
jgi:hypothetical protein